MFVWGLDVVCVCEQVFVYVCDVFGGSSACSVLCVCGAKRSRDIGGDSRFPLLKFQKL